MRLLIDTNIFLEVILAQENAETAQTLLSKTDENEFFVSDYCLHSIGIFLFRKRKHEVFKKFLRDIIINCGFKIISLMAEDMEDVIEVAQQFNFDFDDAYQYVIVKKYNLILVSFDSDFDRSERGRKTPDEILKG